MTTERPLERYQSAQAVLENIQNSYPVSQYPSLMKTVPYKSKAARPAVRENNDDTEIVRPSAVRASHPVEKPVNPQPRSQSLSNPNVSFEKKVDNSQENMQETLIFGDNYSERSPQHFSGSQNQQPRQNMRPPISSSVNRIDPNFVKRCEQELAYCIGPMASLIVEEILPQQLSSNHELIEALAQKIPDAKKAIEFRQRLLSN